MTRHIDDTERNRAVDPSENEGDAAGQRCNSHQYGRRIETDRSWTVYHVFTGAPVHVGSRVMIGLTRSAATTDMLRLNRGNGGRPKERVLPVAPDPAAPQFARYQSCP